MAAKTGISGTAATTGNALTLTRVFGAPRELVWEAWTDPGHAARWWAPEGMTVTSIQMDVRAGGAWSKTMGTPGGPEYRRSGVYREVVEPERLVFTYVTDDPRSNRGEETLVTVTFRDLGTKTRLTLRQAGFRTVEARDAHRSGWASTLGRLVAYLAKTRR